MSLYNSLTFDIETVPQPMDTLSSIQQEELNKRLKRSKNTEELNEEELTQKIMGTSPYFGKIICIGLKLVKDAKDKTTALVEGSEYEILTSFWEILRQCVGVTFISYNGLEFDVPFIRTRSMHHKVNPTNTTFFNLKRFQRHPHCDCCTILADYNQYNRVSLRLACDAFGIPSPKEGGIEAKNVYKFYKEGKIKEIANYCMRDLDSTYQLAQLLTTYSM